MDDVYDGSGSISSEARDLGWMPGAGLQPCSIASKPTEAAPGFQETHSENGHLRCENHTPVGKGET